MKTASMCEVPAEYPTLMLTVTDNPRFIRGRLASADREAVLQRIDKWLKEKMEDAYKNNVRALRK